MNKYRTGYWTGLVHIFQIYLKNTNLIYQIITYLTHILNFFFYYFVRYVIFNT